MKNSSSLVAGSGPSTASSASQQAQNQPSGRTNYHQQPKDQSNYNPKGKTPPKGQGNNSVSGSERRCFDCQYRTPLRQCVKLSCKDCGDYILCNYCYEGYLEQRNGHDDQTDSASGLNASKKNACVYCWSKHTLTDTCVKTLKSLGFSATKGTSTKISIQSLTKEKIRKLTNLRVIQKTLVYVIGLAPEIANEEKLKSVEYFGQYGNLEKVVVNTNNVYNATRGGPSYSAYLTFSNPRESAIAILSVDQFVLQERMIRASFGTSKFCQFFLNGQRCSNKDCLYLHELRSDLEAYTKEDMQNNKFIFLEQQKIAIKLAKALEMTEEQFCQYNLDKNEPLKKYHDKCKKTGESTKFNLPKSERIYYKDFHFLEEPLAEKQRKKEELKKLKAEALKNKEEEQKSDQNPQPIMFSNQRDENNQDHLRNLSNKRPATGATQRQNTTQSDSSDCQQKPEIKSSSNNNTTTGEQAPSKLQTSAATTAAQQSSVTEIKQTKIMTGLLPEGAKFDPFKKQNQASPPPNQKTGIDLFPNLRQSSPINVVVSARQDNNKSNSDANNQILDQGGILNPKTPSDLPDSNATNAADTFSSVFQQSKLSSQQIYDQKTKSMVKKKVKKTIVTSHQPEQTPIDSLLQQEVVRPPKNNQAPYIEEESKQSSSQNILQNLQPQLSPKSDKFNLPQAQESKNSIIAMQSSKSLGPMKLQSEQKTPTTQANTLTPPPQPGKVPYKTDQEINSPNSLQNLQKPAQFGGSQSPAFFSRSVSRFQFAYSQDPKSDLKAKEPLNLSEREVLEEDKDQIMIPRRVQDLITRSIRTYSNSNYSNQSPNSGSVGDSGVRGLSGDMKATGGGGGSGQKQGSAFLLGGLNFRFGLHQSTSELRSASITSLGPVKEQMEDELEKPWLTKGEQLQQNLNISPAANTGLRQPKKDLAISTSTNGNQQKQSGRQNIRTAPWAPSGRSSLPN